MNDPLPDGLSSEIRDYTILSKIGNGRYGTAYKVFSKKYHCEFCMKVITQAEYSSEELTQFLFKKEAETLRRVGHKNVIRLYDYFHEGDYYFIVTEYCSNGTLQSYLDERANANHNQIINSTNDKQNHDSKISPSNANISPISDSINIHSLNNENQSSQINLPSINGNLGTENDTKRNKRHEIQSNTHIIFGPGERGNQKETHYLGMDGDMLYSVFKQIYEAIAFIHSLNIVHRDIKPCNIAFDSLMRPKILDWGYSTVIQEGEKLKSFCGTFPFVAPECLSKAPYDGKKYDMWSLGVTLYMMAFGKMPWKGKLFSEQVESLMNANYDFPENHPNAKPDLMNLIKNLLKVNPNERLSAIEALEHPYFKKCSALVSSPISSSGSHLSQAKICIPNVTVSQILKKSKKVSRSVQGSTSLYTWRKKYNKSAPFFAV
ncbi:hypothetical protein TRFO_24333 [Tritrichomonas foetus]|uniref:Protein kinase domain-containing protein n=1 Tax=Tritrichomonas foetus TaxID=1144522 RepID=A0A1J4K925_9EUKA|nr:hypothetical protein TRFO_24333 [Tritrichomonas foetus]|eukprot:OHT07442.1 hypothetical protein TRFO_24333 [Tritrichomonas foetus]